MMRPSALLYFYGRRLRVHGAQEFLAGVGVAIGVALVFATAVANSSITGSSTQIIRGVTGSASLQIRARDAEGISATWEERVSRLPGVEHTAALFDESGQLTGPNGSAVAIQVESASPRLSTINNLASQLPLTAEITPGVMLPLATALALGLPTSPGRAHGSVLLEIRGHATIARVTSILGPETVGDLSGAMAAFAPLAYVQQAAGLPGRVTRVLVQPAAGQAGRVRRELQALSGGRLTVASADQDIALMRQATLPNSQATGFFGFVAGVVGLLLAFSAMLLTSPARRRLIADLRVQGYRPWQLAQILLSQAAILGVVASAAGLIIGLVLARGVLHERPSYLSAAFPLANQTVITLVPVLVAFLGGVVATLLAASPPLLDLRGAGSPDAAYAGLGEPGHRLGRRVRQRLLLAAGLLVAVATGVFLADPLLAPVAPGAIAIGLVLAVPTGFRLVVAAAERISPWSPRLNMLLMATRSLRRTTARSVALTATGAVAVFGATVVQGTHHDLLQGLYSDYSQYASSADIWVTNAGDELATSSFDAGSLPSEIARIPGVRAVRSYQGGFLDVAGRRVWVIARDSPRAMIPASQIVDGTSKGASQALARGGWITVSQQLAEHEHTRVGGTIRLPTPTGAVTYRVAALTTNLGWTSGTIILNSRDYQRAWATRNPSALEVDVRPGASAAHVRGEIARIVPPGVRAQTSTERAATADVLARDGLARLSQISLLLIVAAAMAMAAAMGAAVWERRPSLASWRIQSFGRLQLMSILIWESMLVLSAGCLMGAVAGVYGEFLGDRYLRLATGFPATFAPQAAGIASVVLLVLGLALVVLSLPGYIASRAPARLALDAP
jgi:putative ABC transport system permease protein